ncbi:hypothetical protein BaRGS_00016108 [Batillaria attramentaria]|uniref:Uncharacterized protein n=1 Tax=Batillaria attramentaria TaxID=370345 RepID=A0ABD0KZH5_9CAEN
MRTLGLKSVCVVLHGIVVIGWIEQLNETTEYLWTRLSSYQRQLVLKKTAEAFPVLEAGKTQNWTNWQAYESISILYPSKYSGADNQSFAMFPVMEDDDLAPSESENDMSYSRELSQKCHPGDL